MINYNPKTGPNAGKKNSKIIEKYFNEHPGVSGVRIAKELNLSKCTIYKHLKKLTRR